MTLQITDVIMDSLIQDLEEVRGIYITETMAFTLEEIEDKNLRRLYMMHLIASQYRRVGTEDFERLDDSVVELVEYKVSYTEMTNLFPIWERLDVLEACDAIEDLGFIMVSSYSDDTADEFITCYLPTYYDLENENKFEMRGMFREPGTEEILLFKGGQ